MNTPLTGQHVTIIGASLGNGADISRATIGTSKLTILTQTPVLLTATVSLTGLLLSTSLQVNVTSSTFGNSTSANNAAGSFLSLTSTGTCTTTLSYTVAATIPYTSPLST